MPKQRLIQADIYINLLRVGVNISLEIPSLTPLDLIGEIKRKDFFFHFKKPIQCPTTSFLTLIPLSANRQTSLLLQQKTKFLLS